MKNESVIVDGKDIQELEKNLNERLLKYLPTMYKPSSPSIFHADGKWVAIIIVEPLL